LKLTGRLRGPQLNGTIVGQTYMATQFRQLNDGWNAEPNAPDPTVRFDGRDLVLTFLANPFQFARFAEGQWLRLRFRGATKYRLGATNDEGWYRGQCRFSGDAPAWGEFGSCQAE